MLGVSSFPWWVGNQTCFHAALNEMCSVMSSRPDVDDDPKRIVEGLKI